MMKDIIVTSEHLRILRQTEDVCVPGAKTWAKEAGVDFKDFMRNGIPAQRLRDSGLHIALRLVEIAEKSERDKE